MGIDRADIERKAEDARHLFEQVRADPQRMRKYIAASILVVVCLVTAIVWLVRLIPDKPPDELERETAAERTSEGWIERSMRKLQREDRFRNISIVESGSTFVIQGRVDTGDDLRDLRLMLIQSGPPSAMQWSVSTDEP